MKINDQVYCFKNVLDLKKNTWYTIDDILSTTIDDKEYRYCKIEKFAFFIDPKNNSWYNFKDYFTSLKEERKEKILKINESKIL